jgi:rhamnogalacturonyl hydrolase YesR
MEQLSVPVMGDPLGGLRQVFFSAGILLQRVIGYWDVLEKDWGAEASLEFAAAWLASAQDCNKFRDGGVARYYNPTHGWSSSYPETTGYVVETMLAYAKWRGDDSYRQRAIRMLDWLVSIQLADGAFQGGAIDASPIVPVAFNTGQILLGLAKGTSEVGEVYRQPMCRAADWLVQAQDPDGCWRRHASPLTIAGDKTYDTHIAWGLLEAARLEPGRGYQEAALANVGWALSRQLPNGWFANCCLQSPAEPLTHTIGYALRGVLEAYRFTGKPHLLETSRRTADGLVGAMDNDGSLPGRLNRDWGAPVKWSCLAGSVQIAYCLLFLYQETGYVKYRDAGYALNRMVRRTMSTKGKPGVRGGIKGSHPFSGGYMRYCYPNWACKFFLDAQMFEIELRRSERSDPAG